MDVIHKQAIVGNECTLELPEGSIIVHVGMQNERPTIWYRFNRERDQREITETRTFHIVGTGHDFPKTWKHCGTFFQSFFVWHLMEE